ncbi:hypothetical protein K492DRAFT_241089 [Lichtheimia hyalospora FSU 10163]|nr:hypothetical protein K492DRAFT_241089 [Lichtheimia hyalospora FSU 10163]
MTALNPSSPIGVLRQGLVQGYMELSNDMIQVYSQALVVANAMTAKRDHVKVDLMTRLDYDIVQKIVGYLWEDIVDTPAFLYVSRSWRKTILQATSYLVHNITTLDSFGYINGEVTALASHVRKIVYIPEDQEKGAELCQVLVDHGSRNLHYLHVELNPFPGCGSFGAMTLTDAMRKPEYGYKYSINEVMALCPNLWSLKWCGRILKNGIGMQYPQLKALDISFDYADNNDYDDLLGDLVQPFPYLRVLAIDAAPDSQHLDTIDAYCPAVNHIEYCQNPHAFIRWTPSTDPYSARGIRELCIGKAGYEDDLLKVVDLLINVSHTVEQFYFNYSFVDPESDVDPMDLLLSVEFPLLNRIRCAPGDSEFQEMLMAVMSEAQTLQGFALDTIDIFWNDSSLMETIASLHFLVEVDLRFEQEAQDLDALKRYLKYHRDLHTLSSLRLLYIVLWTDACEQELLPLITSLTLLKVLKITVNGSQSALTQMIEWLGAEPNSCLKQLTVASTVYTQLDDPVFLGLNKVHSLEWLNVAFKSISTSGALSLLDCNHLTNIYIPRSGLDSRITPILRCKLPSLVIKDGTEIV